MTKPVYVVNFPLTEAEKAGLRALALNVARVAAQMRLKRA